MKIYHTPQMGEQRLRFIFVLCCVLVFSAAVATPAKAAFIGDYPLNQFTLTNTNANGSVVTPDGGLSAVITGGNNGSGEPGTTDLTTTARGSGLVRFDYAYTSLDFPGFDFAGYLVGGSFIQLATFDGQSGQGQQFPVTLGQLFGFRVATKDNTGEPGVLTISNFSAPAATGASVPEPGTLPMMLVAAATLALWRKSGTRQRSGRNKNA